MIFQKPFGIQRRRSLHDCSLTSNIGDGKMLLEILPDLGRIDWRNFNAVSIQGIDHVTTVFHLTTTDHNQLHICRAIHTQAESYQ